MIVDVFSRNPSFHSLFTITVDCKKMIILEYIKDEYTKDEFTTGILSGVVKNKRYVIRDGLILKRNIILLVPNLEVQENILHILHNAPLAGHPRVTKIYQFIWERFMWKGLKDDIYKHV